MPEALSDRQWAGIRALREGALPTDERVAQAAGVYVKTIARRAGEEKWKTLDFRYKRLGAMHRSMIEAAARIGAGEELDPVDPSEGAVDPAWSEGALEMEPLADLPPAERVARIGAALTRHTEMILRRVEAGQPLESRQVAALSNLVLLSERIAALAREEETQKQVKSDEELAELLAKADRRIHSLGEFYARKLAVEKFGIAQEEVDAILPERVDRES